jgi:hypothetical protein
MDYGSAIRLGVGLIASAALAQDSADTLATARDKMLSAVPGGLQYVCVETIDRSYFSRENSSLRQPSCEELSSDRKKGRTRLKLAAADRLRVEVTMTQGREIYDWTGPGAFSRSIEEILQWGPVATGAFGAYLMDIFTNPSVRFRIVDEKGRSLEYGFRVPIEESRLIVRAPVGWRTAGYDGSITIDRSSLEMSRLTMESEELPPETSMCELSATAEYQGEQFPGLLLPSVSRSHNILRDTTETESVTKFSNCHQSAGPSSEREPAAAPVLPAPVLPEGVPFELALTTPVDTASAAAGDVVSARLNTPILDPESRKVLAPKAAIVTGRIIRMEHNLGPRKYFLLSIAFDTVQAGGTNFRLYARSDGNGTGSGHERKDWPMGNFFFLTKQPRYVIPAGYISKWRTTAPVSAR